MIGLVVRQAIEASQKEDKLVKAVEAGSSLDQIQKILDPKKW